MKRFASFAMAGLGLMFFAATSQAANIYIDDASTEGQITVSGVPFCNFVDISIDCTTTISHSRSGESVSFTFYSSIPTAANHGGDFFATMLDNPNYLDEGDQVGQVSDQLLLHLTDGSNAIGVQFISDPDTFVDTSGFTCGSAYDTCNLGSFIEDGSQQLLAQYVFVGDGGEIDNFYAASDVAPEPASMALIGGGLAFLGFWARRRRP